MRAKVASYAFLLTSGVALPFPQHGDSTMH